MKAPFPYFGGKSKVADLVWSRLGDVKTYIEPFCGSMAVLLHKETPTDYEIVNDVDGLLTNFWRACKADPESLTRYAEAPPSEIELTARHNFVLNNKALVHGMQEDPEYYNVKIAAYWLYVRGAMVGGRLAFEAPIGSRVPTLGRQRGMFSTKVCGSLQEVLSALSKRLLKVQVTCGGWERVLTTTPLINRPVAIFFDPPYQVGEFDGGVYEHAGQVFEEVRRWCLDHGDDPSLRIALCGYEGNEMPEGWEVVEWKTEGGYGKIGKPGKALENRHRERIWFSPHCLRPDDQPEEVNFMDLFG